MAPSQSITSLDGTAELVPAPRKTARIAVPSSEITLAQESAGFGYSVDLGNFIGPGSSWGLFGGDLTEDRALTDRYGGNWPADRVQLPNHSTPGIFTEPQWRAGLMWSRWLDDYNPLAIGFRRHITNFIGKMEVSWIRRGQEPTGTGQGREGKDDEQKAVEQLWEEICEANDWGEGIHDREEECRTRDFRDGDVPVRIGPGGLDRDRLPWIRNIEPEQIRSPTGIVPGHNRDDLRWGVDADPEDPDTIRGYWICEPDSGGAKGEYVPAAEIVHMTNNADRTIRRGKSDYFCIETHLQKVMGILSSMESTAHEQADVAWIQTWASSTPDQTRKLLGRGAGEAGLDGFGDGFGEGGLPSRGRGEDGFNMRKHGGSKVLHVGPQTEFGPGPTSTGVPSYVEAINASIKAVRFRLGLPDSFVFGTGDSFAGVLVTGSPFVLEIENRQKKQAGFVKQVALRCMWLAEGSGRLPPGTMAKFKPMVTPASVVMADASKQATITDSELKNKLTSPQEEIRARKRDPKQIVADWKEWDTYFPPVAAAGPGGASPPVPGGKDTTPAPPGSAGGDGTDPPATTEGGPGSLLDIFLVRESSPEPGTHPPPGEGWQYDREKSHWVKPGTGETHPGTAKTAPAHPSIADQDAPATPADHKTLHPVAIATAVKWVEPATHLSQETRETYANTMAHALSKMPEFCRNQAIAAVSAAHGGSKGGVRFHADIATVSAECSKGSGTKEKNVGGFVIHQTGDYRGDYAQMHLDGNNGSGASDTAEAIYLHELGHCVDVGRKYSDDPKFQAAYKKEVTNAKAAAPQLSRYSRQSPVEGFAELHRIMIERGIGFTKTQFPKMMAFMEEKGLLK
jgi:hypothetical protein